MDYFKYIKNHQLHAFILRVIATPRSPLLRIPGMILPPILIIPIIRLLLFVSVFRSSSQMLLDCSCRCLCKLLS